MYKHNYQIAGLTFDFDTFIPDSFWNMWKWKLDPYRIKGDRFPEVIFRKESPEYDEYSAFETPLLKEERSGFFSNTVRRLPDGHTMWSMVQISTGKSYISYMVDQNWRQVTLLADETNSGGQAAFEYISHILPSVLLKHRILSFHSALVEYRGRAFALCGNSGVGKTTRARLWRDLKGALILNGDRTVCRNTGDGWESYGTPWSGTSGEQINRSAPLMAMVILERADDEVQTDTFCNAGDRSCECCGDGNVMVKRLTPAAALPLLLPHLQYPAWDVSLMETALAEFDSLLNDIPVFLLRCHPNAEGVELLERALQEVW